MSELGSTWTLGTYAQIIDALNSVNDEPWCNERLYPAIAHKLAGRELNEPGINLAFHLALIDAVKADGEGPTGAASFIARLMGIDADKYVKAFIATAGK